MGGLDCLRRLSAAFYDRVLADELLAPVFAHFTPTHLDHVAVWLAEVFAGPADFSAHLGGHQALLRSHLGLGIRDEHRQRWLDLMADAISEVLPGRARAGRDAHGVLRMGHRHRSAGLAGPRRNRSGRPRPHPPVGTPGSAPLTRHRLPRRAAEPGSPFLSGCPRSRRGRPGWARRWGRRRRTRRSAGRGRCS
nr:group II truncated hemoglobin [Candidatus Frankia alpina]